MTLSEITPNGDLWTLMEAITSIASRNDSGLRGGPGPLLNALKRLIILPHKSRSLACTNQFHDIS